MRAAVAGLRRRLVIELPLALLLPLSIRAQSYDLVLVWRSFLLEVVPGVKLSGLEVISSLYGGLVLKISMPGKGCLVAEM